MAQSFDMGGFPIRQPLPAPGVSQIDPFLLLHHARLEVSPDTQLAESGVGPHPHRGFSPVTFLFEGGVHHRDSAGNSNVVYAGGVQWMNAGRGLIHSERPPEDIQAHGGVQELIQLWINTPAQHKMDAPAYFPVSAEDMPILHLPGTASEIRLVSGELEGKKGAIDSLFPVLSCMVYFEAGAQYFFPIAAEHEAIIYVLQGKLQIGDARESIAATYEAAWLNTEGSGIWVAALENTRFLLVAAAPLHEPVASHGPFVMNTRAELVTAFEDYQQGKMGVLVE